MKLNLSDSIEIELPAIMMNPSSVRAYCRDPNNANPDPWIPGVESWGDLALANGYPSLLILYASLEREGLVKEGIAHRYVLAIKESIERGGYYDCSLFSGLSGICFSLKLASRQGTRYQRFLGTLEEMLIKRTVESYLSPIRDQIRSGQSVQSSYYDTIQGICGIGRYALESLSQPNLHSLASQICEALVLITNYRKIGGHRLPGWHLTAEDPINRGKLVDAKGTFNLGLSHGVTGILALLSIASLKGLVVDGQKDAIRSIATWIQKKAIPQENSYDWPHAVTFHEEVNGVKPTKSHSRDAWCYGAPGIARTLYLAGKALDDQPLKSYAQEAFQQIFHRSQKEWNLPGPTLCHGLSGLLLLTHAMTLDTGCDKLLKKVDELKERVLAYYQPSADFGFTDFEPCKKGGYFMANNPGYLEGAAGVYLTLLSMKNKPSNWHLPLLINE
jgi:lantibiotic biosynthesis protein